MLKLNTYQKLYCMIYYKEYLVYYETSIFQEQSPDASMVATMLIAVLKELTTEQKTLDSYITFYTEFMLLKASLEPWLTKKPKLEEIEKHRKELRSLKSKLRHKEADRQDLLEEGETGEEWTHVQKEVDHIKTLLHYALDKMDKAQAELASQTNEHFPEYRDDGMETYLVRLSISFNV